MASVLHTLHNPGGIAPPFSRYAQGVEASDRSRWLHISGKIGVTADGGLAHPDWLVEAEAAAAAP